MQYANWELEKYKKRKGQDEGWVWTKQEWSAEQNKWFEQAKSIKKRWK